MKKRIIIDVEYDPNSIEIKDREFVSYRLLKNVLDFADDGYLDMDEKTVIVDWDFDIQDIDDQGNVIPEEHLAEPGIPMDDSFTGCYITNSGLRPDKVPIGTKTLNREIT